MVVTEIVALLLYFLVMMAADWVGARIGSQLAR
jgi:hypothetical protein